MHPRTIAASAALALAGTTLLVATPAAAATLPEPEVLETFERESTYNVSWATAVGDLVYFIREYQDDPDEPGTAYPRELWWTDGEQAAPIEVLDEITDLVEFDGALYFAGRDQTGGVDRDGLWTASPAGVQLLESYVSLSDSLPAIERLTVAGDLLYYHHEAGVGDERLIAWDGTEAVEMAVFVHLNPAVVAGGDGVFVEGAHEVGDPSGTWWVGPSGVEFIVAGVAPEDAIEWNGWMLLSTSTFGGSFPQLVAWNGTEVRMLLASFDGGEFVADDDRVLFLGWTSEHDGVWSWDGAAATPIGQEFERSASLLPWEDGFVFIGRSGPQTGLWRLDGDGISFQKEWELVNRSFHEFGGTILIYGGYDDDLYQWDGTTADPHPVGDSHYAYSVASTAEFALLFDRDDPAESYVVRVISGPELESIAIAPASSTVVAGDSQTFTVTATDADGGTHDVTDHARFATDAPEATVLGNTITFTRAGTFGVTAELGGLTAQATVTVEPGALAAIELSPADPVLSVGAVQQFTVTGEDAHGNQLGDVTAGAEFASTVPEAEVGGTGRIVFPAIGTGTVTATVDGVSADTPVTVEAGEVESIRLELSATSVPVGGSVTATVAGVNEHGVVILDLSGSARLTSDVDTDIVDELTVTFPTASPHTITAEVTPTAGQALTDSVVVEVVPADAPDGGLATSGVDAVGLGAAAFAVLSAGLALVGWRRVAG